MAKMSPIAVPRPTWDVPERVEMLWLSRSLKLKALPLKPTVLTLAMLSPMICMALPRLLRPLIPENNELDNDILITSSYWKS